MIKEEREKENERNKNFEVCEERKEKASQSKRILNENSRKREKNQENSE